MLLIGWLKSPRDRSGAFPQQELFWFDSACGSIGFIYESDDAAFDLKERDANGDQTYFIS